MKTNKLAFTLTELLIALGVIGAIAAISIPSLMTTINNKLTTTQMKNITTTIQQLIADQMVAHKTKTLADTDFKSDTAIYSDLSTIAACNANRKCFADQYTTIYAPTTKATETFPFTPSNGMLLKNGATIFYQLINYPTYKGTEDETIGIFYVDINGPDRPNIIGRDLFSFFVTKAGKIRGSFTANPGTCDTTHECYQALLFHGWVMPKDADYWVKE